MLTSYLQDKLLTIALTGEIDHHSARQIIEQLGEKIDQYLPASCVLDFQGVSFMDSSGTPWSSIPGGVWQSWAARYVSKMWRSSP